jgi:transposase
MTSDITKRIDQFLELNEQRIKAGLRKQVMNATDMHRELERENFEVSYRSVSNYVSSVKNKKREVFIKSDYPPGFAAEFDWGDVSLIINEVSGSLRRYKLGVFALKHSTKVYSDLYLNENTESFLDIHANYFESLEGVPHQITYDNARVQVKRFAGTVKEPTDALVNLTSYYGYKHRFANVYSGNEKGTVERYVDVVRTRAFSKNIHFKTLHDARSALQNAINELNSESKQLKEKTVLELFKEEQKQFLKNRIKLDVGQFIQNKVSKYSFIFVDNVFYSVPDYLVGKTVDTYKYPTYLKIFYNGILIDRVNRQYTKHSYQVNISHYIDTFKKKPGAIASSLALKQAKPWLQKIFHHYFNTNGKDFVLFLQLLNEFSQSRLEYIIQKLEYENVSINISTIQNELINEAIPSEHKYDDLMIDKFVETQLNDLNKLFLNGGDTNAPH